MFDPGSTHIPILKMVDNYFMSLRMGFRSLNLNLLGKLEGKMFSYPNLLKNIKIDG